MVILLLIIAGAYLFWPLDSENFQIQVDQEKLASKQTFLKQIKTPASDSLPNILLIIVDDLGMADLSLYGEGYPNTPHIDALGNEGVVFQNAYVTSPVCSPSRAAIFTGRYPQRFGFEYQMHDRYLRNRLEYFGFKLFVDSAPWIPKWMSEVPDKTAIDQQGIPPSEITLPDLMKARGYRTGLVGKWHLGSDQDRSPCNFSFDYQFGFYASHSLYAYEQTHGIHDQKVPGDFTDPHIWSGQRDGPYAIYQNCEEIRVEEYLTDRFTDEAIKFISETDQDPFFLTLSYNAPHTPLQAPQSDMDRFDHIEDPIKRTYYAMIANLDDNIGRLMDHLRINELDSSTAIFLISDNGGAEYTFTTENGKYKGGKITNFEGGIKVPFMMRWEGTISPSRYNPMVSSMDIFQTVTEMTDCSLPDDRVYDGKNLLPFVKGMTDAEPHDYLYWQRGFNKAVRNADWKLMINEEVNDTLLVKIGTDQFEEKKIKDAGVEVISMLANQHTNWSNNLQKPLWPSLIYYEFWDGNNRYYFDQ